jgi:hypothetical protein
VHICPRGVLRRRPQSYSAMSYVTLLPRRVRELYCQTTYFLVLTYEAFDSSYDIAHKYKIKHELEWMCVRKKRQKPDLIYIPASTGLRKTT